MVGCNQLNQNSENESGQNDSLETDIPDIVIETTASPIEPLEIFPSPFVSDSIFIEDTAFNFAAVIYFPKSTEDDEFNKFLQQLIQYEINLEKPENKTNDQTSFEMWVTNLTVSENLTQVLFKQQTYTEGSAHYNHESLTFNYDHVKKKRILFTDIFRFSKNKSKQSFCNELNGYTNGMNDSEGYRDGLVPDNINKDLNYSFSDRQLIVYPNYCCADEGKIFTVDLELIIEYIDPEPGKDYGLIFPDKEKNYK